MMDLLSARTSFPLTLRIQEELLYPILELLALCARLELKEGNICVVPSQIVLSGFEMSSNARSPAQVVRSKGSFNA